VQGYAGKPGPADPGIVKHQEGTGFQEGWEFGYAAVLPPAACPVQHHKPGPVPLRRRVLGDTVSGKFKIKVGKFHRIILKIRPEDQAARQNRLLWLLF
jgi:hypothetical protein